MQTILKLITVAASAAAACASASSIQAAEGLNLSGYATADDGDSLSMNGKRIRLFGIDAPELDQTCEKSGSSWACGQEAKRELAYLVRQGSIECSGREMDKYDRIVAVCSVNGRDINRIMVATGWATAYRHYSQDYIAAEEAAKAQRIGIWSSNFTNPSEYRQMYDPREQRAIAPQPKKWTGGCTIKGNRNRKGEWIYHLPGMPYYDQTRAEEIFCSEEAAQKAGYRRAIVR